MLDKDEIFIDRYSFEQIWDILVVPTMESYSNRFAEIVIAHNAREAVWNKYVKLNTHCKEIYMEDPTGKIDRHKVCACYMYAIVDANVMSCKLADSDTEERYLALNENLAITVGTSLLRAFVIVSINKSKELSEKEKEHFRTKIDNGIIFPECNHGTYRENFVSELHYSRLEHNYNILSLANTLFLLETHTLETEAVHKVEQKGKKKKK